MANIVLISNELSGLNYSIAPSVTSNNLTVAIKDAAGDDPTSTSPCVFRVGGSERILSTSLSVAKNAGTSWAGLGSANLGTLEHDLFVYIVWNTNTSALDVLWSRIAHATLYSDFSATTTAQNYGAINATAPASTDDVVNIGRFAATLSLTGTGHLWTVPTYTTSNLIQRPCFETRWLTWIPTISGYSANPTDTVYIYRLNGRMCELNFREATAGTSNNASHTYTAPFTAATRTNMVWSGGTFVPLDNNANVANGTVSMGSASNSCSFQLSARAGHTASGNSRIQWANLAFEV